MPLFPWILSFILGLMIVGLCYYHWTCFGQFKGDSEAATEEFQFELHARDERLLVIHRISESLIETSTLQPLLQSIVNSCTDALRASGGSIMIKDEEDDLLRIAASRGLSDELVQQTTVQMDDGLAGWVAAKRTPLLIKDIRQSERFSNMDTGLYKGQSLISAPMICKDKLYGVINITDRKGGAAFDRDDLLTLTSIASQSAILIENARNYQKMCEHLEEIKMLHKVTEEITQSLDLETTIQRIARMAIHITHTDACSVRLLDEASNELVIYATCNLGDHYNQKGALKVGEGVGGYVAKSGEPVMIPNLKEDKRVSYTEYLQGEGLMSLVSVPMKNTDGQVTGIISVYLRREHVFGDNVVKLLQSFANNTSMAINNAKLFYALEANYYETIQSLALTIEARDSYTEGHSERVTHYALQIGKAMGLEKRSLEQIRYSGRLHDIGKISIPDRLLAKPGKLTLEEYKSIKTHPAKGAEMIHPLRFLDDVAALIRHHHERFDGGGYPDGLDGLSIPKISRILAVADAYDAMTSQRPYQEPLSLDAAKQELIVNRGSQFDPDVVDSFLSILDKKS